MAEPATTAVTMFGGIALLFILVWFFLLAVSIFGLIIWIIMLVDVVQRKFKNENDKVMWILIVVLTGIIGALIYYFIIKRPNKH